jgi:hypothetical protein
VEIIYEGGKDGRGYSPASKRPNPGASIDPVAFGGSGGNVHELGRFFQGGADKVAEFELSLDGIFHFELLKAPSRASRSSTGSP